MDSPYLDFDRTAWAALRAATPLTLTEADLSELQGLNERVSLADVEEIYLPVSRLLNLHVAATQTLHKATETFLNSPPAPTPYVIGVGGSVAVGKSTFARILRALLARWPDHPRVDLVTTDGFLLSNEVLEERGQLARKGFPESYDVRSLIQFMVDVKAAKGAVHAPVYSHQAYDIVPGEFQVVDRPDIVIVEGLNVLQTADAGGSGESRRSDPDDECGSRRRTGDGQSGKSLRVFVSDFFDFSVYIDAAESDIERWYVSRFLTLRQTVFRNPRSYFHRYASLTEIEAIATAQEIWRTINGVNLRENIVPTRGRARLILEKAGDHAVRRIRLRQV